MLKRQSLPMRNAGILTLLQQLVDRGWMHVERYAAYFAHGHYFDWPRIVRRLGSIFTFHLKSLSTRANSARLRIARSKKAKGRAQTAPAFLSLWPGEDNGLAYMRDEFLEYTQHDYINARSRLRRRFARE